MGRLSYLFNTMVTDEPGQGTPSMLGDMDVQPFWPPFWHSGVGATNAILG